MDNLVIVKFPPETRVEVVDFTQLLDSGETVVSAVLGAISPAGLTASLGAVTTTGVPLTVGTGSDGQSYGVPVLATTSNARVLSRLVAVVCNSQIAYDYQNVNLNAFATLVEELEVGQAAVGNAAFMFPPDFNAAGGQVTWELLDQDGRVYSSGTSFDYQVDSLSDAIKVMASGVINVPSSALPTLQGQSYQVRWKLVVGGQTYYSFETIRVTGRNTTPQGPRDVVEIAGENFPVEVVFSQPYERVFCAVYYQNDRQTPDIPVFDTAKVSDGQLYQIVLEDLALPARLDPYQIMWTGFQANRPANTERQTGRIHIVNTSILSAVNDLRVMINKANTTIFHEEDMIFTDALLLTYLLSGRDYFNGAGAGMLTAFTMLNAQGSIREFWIRCSAVAALRAQYLAEGEKAFNFSGQAISLDVDRTQYYQGLADQLKSELDQELKPYKQNLIKKGIIAGDGNMDPQGGIHQRYGAAGAVGITVTPATGWSKFGARWGVRR